MATNAGFLAKVKEQSSATVFTDEATSTSDDTTYQMTDSAKRIFDFDTVLIVEDAGSPTTDNFTVNKLAGTVTFESSDGGRVITFTGKYVTLVDVVEAKEWNFDATTDMGDVTIFEDTDRSFKPLLTMGTATIGKFYSIDNYFIDLLFNGEIKVLEFYADASQEPFRAFALVSSDSINTAIESLVEESITFQITNQFIIGG
jgi:hypothetical protein